MSIPFRLRPAQTISGEPKMPWSFFYRIAGAEAYPLRLEMR
jgi:hypothetical protein